MAWWGILALVLVILFPAALIWYINIGGMYVAIKDALKRRAALWERTKALAETEHR